MKKFKKFIKDNKVLVLVSVLVLLFILLSVLVKDKDETSDLDLLVNEWYTNSKEGGVVVTVLGQTWCNHCKNFKPVVNEVQKEYGFKLYWFDLDELSVISKTTVTNTYDLYDSFGTPYTFITNNGEFVADYQQGEMSKDDLISFLKENGVIED